MPLSLPSAYVNYVRTAAAGRLGETLFGLYGARMFSPDDTSVVLQGGPITDDLVLRALDGSEARTLVTGPYRNRAPAWSPDGRTIAFGSDRGGKYEIWSIGADGGALRGS